MSKNKESINTLIKKNQLIKILKKGGIKRFQKEALKVLEQKIIDELKKDSKLMVRKLMLEGRKTLTKGDVKSITEAKSKEEEEFEI